MKRHAALVLGIGAGLAAVAIAGTAGAAPAQVQRVHVGWHMQSGNGVPALLAVEGQSLDDSLQVLH